MGKCRVHTGAYGATGTAHTRNITQNNQTYTEEQQRQEGESGGSDSRRNEKCGPCLIHQPLQLVHEEGDLKPHDALGCAVCKRKGVHRLRAGHACSLQHTLKRHCRQGTGGQGGSGRALQPPAPHRRRRRRGRSPVTDRRGLRGRHQRRGGSGLSAMMACFPAPCCPPQGRILYSHGMRHRLCEESAASPSAQ